MRAENDIAIKVSHLSKVFYPQSSSKTVKEAFVGLGRKLSGRNELHHHEGEYRALNDISFEIKKGEFFGIVGRNGSGKSTLLKILAGVYSPTKGHVQVNGKLTPFIELGVGFNPELSGRDNVFLNGALLGFTRKQMADMYDEIVDFAELHDFMDTKLKNYSSGMQVRLAFSVAIRAQSDILLIDEVLAVGDAAFQQKCFDYFDLLKRNKKTVILVTHDMNVIHRYCTNGALIDRSNLLMTGDAKKIANEYSKINNESIDANEKESNDSDEKIHLKTKDTKGAKSTFITGSDMIVEMAWDEMQDTVGAVGIELCQSTGERVFATNTIGHEHDLSSSKIEYTLALNIGPGSYYLQAALFDKSGSRVLAFTSNGPQIRVRLSQETQNVLGVARLDYAYNVPSSKRKYESSE